MAPDSGTSRHGIRAFSRVTPRLVVSAAVALLVAGGGLALSAALGSAPSSVTIVRADANGATVHVGVGDRLELILSSDYWHVHGSSSAAVLTQDGSARYLPRPGSCPDIPGLGCIPIQTSFTALARGTAVITASRTTCGEALRCLESQQRFTVTVVVR